MEKGNKLTLASLLKRVFFFSHIAKFVPVFNHIALIPPRNTSDAAIASTEDKTENKKVVRVYT